MTGLIVKDFLVFNKRFSIIYRLICAIILIGLVVFYPTEGAMYIAILLPVTGCAFLAELSKVEEKSDWKDYLPVLPISISEIVLSRYLFCAILLAGLSIISFVSCAIAALIGGFALYSMTSYFILGVVFAVFMLLFGIPCGYLFKNELSTGAMIGAIFLLSIMRSMGLDVLFFTAVSSISYIIAILIMAVLIYASYRMSLLVYKSKRYSGDMRQ